METTQMNNESDEIIIIDDQNAPAETPKEKTKTEIFKERLSQYASREEAKAHILEIAQELGCVKSIGYKALKQIDTFKSKDQAEGVEPTLKIGEAKIDQLEEVETREPPIETLTTTQETGERGAGVPSLTPPLTTTPAQTGFDIEGLQWLFGRGFKMIAEVTGYAGFELPDKDSKKLAEVWCPIVNQYLPDIMPYSPLIIAGVSTVVIVVPRVKGYLAYRKEKAAMLPTPKPEPPKTTLPEASDHKPEIATPTPPPTEPPTPLEPPPANERPKNAPWLEKL